MLLVPLFALMLCQAHYAASATPPDWSALHARAVGTLQGAMATESAFVKVHAAEALVRHGFANDVRRVFEPLADTADAKWRVGVWRVLAELNTGTDREKYLARIYTVFVSGNIEERTGAAETLAKLRYRRRSPELIHAANEATGGLQACARWALATSGHAADERALAEFLSSTDEYARLCAAYGLRQLARIRPVTLGKLDAAWTTEPAGSTARVYIASARFVHSAKTARDATKKPLLEYAEHGKKDERYEATAALARRGDLQDVPLLSAMLEDAEADVRIGAADALLIIERGARASRNRTCPS